MTNNPCTPPFFHAEKYVQCAKQTGCIGPLSIGLPSFHLGAFVHTLYIYIHLPGFFTYFIHSQTLLWTGLIFSHCSFNMSQPNFTAMSHNWYLLLHFAFCILCTTEVVFVGVFVWVNAILISLREIKVYLAYLSIHVKL